MKIEVTEMLLIIIFDVIVGVEEQFWRLTHPLRGLFFTFGDHVFVI